MNSPAEIVVTGRNVDLSDHYRSHIAEKLGRLEHLNRRIVRYDVELNHEQNPRQSKSAQRVAITSHGKGLTVRAEACGPDAHTALDAAVGRLEAQLRRSHDHHQVHHYRHRRTTIAADRT